MPGPKVTTDRSMAFRWLDEGLMLSFEYCDALDDVEWGVFVDALASYTAPPPGARVLVYNAGGGPNAAQRALFGRRLRGRPLRIAVLSALRFPHVIATAFHAIGFSQVLVFTPEQEEGAFRHLGLGAPEIARVRAAVAELRERAPRAPPTAD